MNDQPRTDGYIVRPDGDIDWLTRRPPPKGFYGMGKFMQSIDTKLLGRKTYEMFYPAWSDNSNSAGSNPDGMLHQFDLYTATVSIP